MDLQSIGKILVAFAVVLALAGALLWVGGLLGLGRLPGDLRFGDDRWSCYIPIATTLILSVILTLLLNLLFRLFR
ncbi:MAG: DUF2905 family protein [Coriobacteriia bacterium]|nr:DUF2905 family protein [Coriobacteriia bacterium]